VPNPIANLVLTGTAYTDAATIDGIYGGQGGSFYITGGNFVARVRYGQQGAEQYRPEKQSGPGPGVIDKGAIGIAFRNADAANPATIVSAEILPPGQPGFSITAPSSVSQAGKSVITGIIPAAGTTPTAGTGFTYTHVNGSGVYVFTFTAGTFAATPDIQTTINQTGINSPTANVSPFSASGFTVTTQSVGTPGDLAFSFTAQPVS
jgi:hypothetical protein